MVLEKVRVKLWQIVGSKFLKLIKQIVDVVLCTWLCIASNCNGICQNRAGNLVLQPKCKAIKQINKVWLKLITWLNKFTSLLRMNYVYLAYSWSCLLCVLAKQEGNKKSRNKQIISYAMNDNQSCSSSGNTHEFRMPTEDNVQALTFAEIPSFHVCSTMTKSSSSS